MVDFSHKSKGHPNNKHRVAIKHPDLRQKAYQSFCDHIAKGKSVKSWWFEEGNISCTWETMYKYMKDTSEFDPQKRSIAEAKGFGIWEKVVEDAAEGKNRKANTASLQMLMRNKFGWDKEVQAKQIPNDALLEETIRSLKEYKK